MVRESRFAAKRGCSGKATVADPRVIHDTA